MNRKVLIGFGIVGFATAATIFIVNHKRSSDVKKKLAESDTSADSASEKLNEVSEPNPEEQGSTQLKKSVKITPTTLVIGSVGRPVALFQAYLNYRYGTSVKVDGRYGNETRDALRDKLNYICTSYVGDSTCAIKSTDDIAKSALRAVLDKGFMNYFKPYYKTVASEFEPIKWGGVQF